jgi:hypothetical protein
MSDSQSEPVGEVKTALLDAELFVKYHAPERAIKRLRTALERSPRSIQLRERLRDRREPQSRTTFSPSPRTMRLKASGMTMMLKGGRRLRCSLL